MRNVNKEYKMGKVTKLLEQIINPSSEYTPVPFWFFNDRPDREKIKKQLEDFVSKGVNGIVIHPRIGMPKDIPYLSETYFNEIIYIVQTASELKMKIVLYDEGMYPSGSAHGMVVAENSEFASRGIRLTDNAEGIQILAKLSDGRYLVEDYTKGTIRGIHFGEDDGEEHTPLSADIFNPQAVSCFIRLTHEQYYKHLKKYFGNTIIGFFTDEPYAMGRNTEEFREWYTGMQVEIEAAGGKVEELAALFRNEKNHTTEIYHRLIKQHLCETFYAPLSKWCEEHGIFLMGHPAECDDIQEEFYFHIPGQDLIQRRIVPMTGGLEGKESVQAKLSADIARHLGRKRNANECFGVCFRKNIPWYFTGQDMKWYIDWLAVRGVNFFLPHAFYYSVDGKRKDERPPDVGPNNIWWEHYDMFSKYMKRMAYLMTDSVNGAKVAVLCDDARVPVGEIAELYKQQIEFNYLPVALLSQCKAADKRLCIREYQYEAVLDTGNYLNEKKYEAIKEEIAVADTVEKLLEKGKLSRAVITENRQENLRAVHLVKAGVDMYLLNNEGFETITEKIQLPSSGRLLQVDLWNGKYEVTARDRGDCKGELSISLLPCETMLIIEDSLSEVNEICRKKGVFHNWNERFVLIEKKNNKARYQYEYDHQEDELEILFEVTGEEMAECYCNGELAGVSFWNPHQFEVSKYLKKGTNKIEIIMTGTAANIYENAKIPFGLMEDRENDL